MKYMGSKARHAKYIIPIIKQHLTKDCLYIEPFVGGANMIDKIAHPKRIGSDINCDLIEMFKAVQNGWVPPDELSELQYQKIKANPHDYPPELVAFTAIGCSYSGKWWGGYARGNTNKGEPRNYCLESKKNLLAQRDSILDVKFICSSYDQLEIPDGSVIYCDPPYAGSTRYKDSFDHQRFWNWCDDLSDRATVLVSEYNAPDGWDSLWQKEVTSSLTADTGSKRNIERLFGRI